MGTGRTHPTPGCSRAAHVHHGLGAAGTGSGALPRAGDLLAHLQASEARRTARGSAGGTARSYPQAASRLRLTERGVATTRGVAPVRSWQAKGSDACCRLQPLDDGRDPLAEADAHRLQPDALVGALQLVQQRRHELGPGAAERMAERDCATVDVHSLHVRMKLAPPGEYHRRE